MEKELVFSSDFTLHSAGCPLIGRPKEIIRGSVLLGVPIVTRCICPDCLSKVNAIFVSRWQVHAPETYKRYVAYASK